MILVNIQNLILTHYRILLLVGGVLTLFLGVAPIVSRQYYERFYESKWDDRFWPFSKEDGYIYDRYTRQTYPILIGIALIAMAIYKFLYP